MSSIVNTLIGGVSGNTGGAGMNYQAGAANLQMPTTAAQADEQYGNVKQGLENQNAFLQALQGQNGLQNQSNVFNQLQNVANGQGPNPAQAMLANATGQNVAQQAALMAGQRGASANPALIARQAGMLGANAGQQVAGQGAALQAQQSLNAINQMGGVATNQANQLANATNAYTNAAQGAQGNILGAIGQQNTAQVGNTSSQNSANSGVAGHVADQQGNLFGGILGGIGSAFGLAHGGAVHKFADGGMTIASDDPSTPLVQSQGATSGPQSFIGKFMQGAGDSYSQPQMPMSQAGQATGKSAGNLVKGGLNALITMGLSKGGEVPAMVSPGERYLPPKEVEKVKDGKDPMKAGAKVPGKPKVGGAKDSYANDTVPAKLEEGGIVIPRSITQSKDAPEKAKKFVQAVLAKQNLKR